MEESEQKILEFLSQEFKFDLSGGDSELNLDMTLEEAEFLYMASDEVKAKAQSGELLELTAWIRDFYDKKNVLLSSTYDAVDKVLNQIESLEDEIVEDLQEESDEFVSLRKLDET